MYKKKRNVKCPESLNEKCGEYGKEGFGLERQMEKIQ